MDQRLRFIADHEKHLFSVSELCARFGVSRKTGYKWIDRYQVEGPAGLHDRSRKPHTCAHQTPREIVDALLEARRRHPTWGAKKLLRILWRRHPDWDWPARSTCCDLLKRHGLVLSPRRRRVPSHPTGRSLHFYRDVLGIPGEFESPPPEALSLPEGDQPHAGAAWLQCANLRILLHPAKKVANGGISVIEAIEHQYRDASRLAHTSHPPCDVKPTPSDAQTQPLLPALPCHSPSDRRSRSRPV